MFLLVVYYYPYVCVFINRLPQQDLMVFPTHDGDEEAG